jgi:hypothetical protein
MDRIRRLILVALCAAPLFAAAPPGRADDREITLLIAQLGDRDFARRDAAQRRLAAFGPSALPALTRALKSPDLEVRRRALRLIGVLEQVRDFRPKRISATFRNAPLDKVFAEIHAQTGLKVQQVDPGGEQRFSGSFRDATFWEVLDAVCAAGKLLPIHGTDEMARPAYVMLQPARRASRFVSRDGVFRVAVHRVDQQSSVDLDDDDGNDQPPAILLQLSVIAEPRFEFLHVGEPRLESATDDRGRSLLPTAAPPMPDDDGELIIRTENGAEGGGGGLNFQALLSRHFADSRRIRSLKGALPVKVIIGHTSRLAADKLVKGKTFTFGPNEASVEQVRAVKRQTEVRLRLKVPAGTDEGLVDERLRKDLEFQDADGKPCPHQMVDQPEEWLFVFRVRPSRRGGKPPVRLVVREPIVRPVEIGFEFRDLPLP